MLRTLLQPRYAALSALMLVVAAICTTAGVWQVVRLGEKISANDALRTNAHAGATPVATVLPVQGTAPPPHTDAVEYRTVTASGVYLSTGQVLVRQRSVNSDTGYLVLTPFKTSDGPTLLVVRGFVSGTASRDGSTPDAGPAPSGSVDIRGRVRLGESRHDQFAALHNGQVESINPGDESARLGLPVYDGYVNLQGGQPGTARLITIPEPDLSNPAGGAVEPQHIAYVIQWFLFAALALAAPFVMARAETRRSDRGDVDALSSDPLAVNDPDDEPSDEDQVAERLAARYGRARRVR